LWAPFNSVQSRALYFKYPLWNPYHQPMLGVRIFLSVIFYVSPDPVSGIMDLSNNRFVCGFNQFRERNILYIANLVMVPLRLKLSGCTRTSSDYFHKLCCSLY
jgi:hypothetical protein